MTEHPQPRVPREPHRLCKLLRELRHASGLSLGTIETKTGFSAVVLGAYERGDRTPPLSKLEYVFGLYGYELQAVPMGTSSTRLSGDIVADLRAIADQVETRENDMLLSAHPELDHSSHSKQWVDGCPECPADSPELADAHAV